MSSYERWSLFVTATYDLLTFLLLLFVACQTLVMPRLPKIGFYLQRISRETKNWSWRADLIDFVLENRGTELSDLKITSAPDDLGWGRFSADLSGTPTSEAFAEPIPYVGENERRLFGWCELQSNADIANKPFEITIEFDNPALPYPKRMRRTFTFNISSRKGTAWGVTGRYDIHNVAQECARIREQLEVMNRAIPQAVEAAFRRREEDEG